MRLADFNNRPCRAIPNVRMATGGNGESLERLQTVIPVPATSVHNVRPKKQLFQ